MVGQNPTSYTSTTPPDNGGRPPLRTTGYRARENDDYTPAEAQRLSTVDNVLDDAFKRKDGTSPPSLADNIAGRTLKFALDWALIKVATTGQ